MKKGKMFPNILTVHPQDLLVCECPTSATANESVDPYFSFWCINGVELYNHHNEVIET